MNVRVVFLMVCIGCFSLMAKVTADTPRLDLNSVEGFGANTKAGTGGSVIKVAHLGHDGEGSLRWALAQKGPRIVVFEVGGVIDLAGQGIEIDEPFLTLAGQTAPSPGITLIRGGLRVLTHDVRIEHIRIRPGDNFEEKLSGWETDAIAVAGGQAQRVHIDHVSVSWAVDENLSATGQREKGWGFSASDVTFSNSIIAEALDYASHEKGKHSKGLLVHDYVKNVAVVGNLFISNDRRNPYFKSHASGVVVNNLMYNLGNQAVHVDFIPDEWKGTSLVPGNPQIAVVGNLMHYGRDTYSDLAMIYGRGDVFLHDNGVYNLMNEPMPQGGSAVNLLDKPPVWPEGLTAMSVDDVEQYVLASAGARPWDRDAIDVRIVQDYKQRTSRIIDSQDDVGGYPKYRATTHKLNVPAKNVEAWLESFRR